MDSIWIRIENVFLINERSFQYVFLKDWDSYIFLMVHPFFISWLRKISLTLNFNTYESKLVNSFSLNFTFNLYKC